MTISFDAMWIPIAITVLGMCWAGIMLRDIGSTGFGVFDELSIGVAWPGLIVLGAWLVWALLT